MKDVWKVLTESGVTEYEEVYHTSKLYLRTLVLIITHRAHTFIFRKNHVTYPKNFALHGPKAL